MFEGFVSLLRYQKGVFVLDFLYHNRLTVVFLIHNHQKSALQIALFHVKYYQYLSSQKLVDTRPLQHRQKIVNFHNLSNFYWKMKFDNSMHCEFSLYIQNDHQKDF